MKIERMLAICILFVVVICGVLISDGISIYKSSQVQLSNAALLTKNTITSLTHQTFTIDNIYVNDKKTQAVIVLDGDLSNVSYIADTYQVFVDGKHSDEYSGGVYVFGELNKLCIFITSVDGFESELTQFVVRCNAPTGQVKEMHEAYEGQSSSYGKFDQMAFVSNMGASEAQSVKFLTDSGVDIDEMAEMAFSHQQDTTIREQLTTLQADAVAARTQLNSVRRSLDGMDIQLPVFPEWCQGDKVAVREGSETEYIETTYVFDGYADFDWENHNRLENYADIAGVNPNKLNINQENDSNSNVNTDAPTEWYRNDNSLITEFTTAEQSLISQYSSALSTYKTAKKAYQAKVAELIMTQNDYLTGVKEYTSHVGADVIIPMK